MHTRRRACSHSRTLARTYARTHARTHAHTHTHTHTHSLYFCWKTDVNIRRILCLSVDFLVLVFLCCYLHVLVNKNETSLCLFPFPCWLFCAVFDRSRSTKEISWFCWGVCLGCSGFCVSARVQQNRYHDFICCSFFDGCTVLLLTGTA